MDIDVTDILKEIKVFIAQGLFDAAESLVRKYSFKIALIC